MTVESTTAEMQVSAPDATRGVCSAAGVFGLFALLSVVLTWPLALHLDELWSVRGDYFNNLWNVWWLERALFVEHVTPFWTDYLHYPYGISLAKHTLSPLNALSSVAIGSSLGSPASLNVLILFHFAFAGWAMFLLARRVSGSAGGAFLAGLLYAFSPYRYFYLAEINVSSMGLLPLSLHFLLRTRSEGGSRNVLATALCLGATAASASYYLVYVYLVGGLVVLFGRLLDRDVPFGRALRRLSAAGGAGALFALAAAWPLVSTTLGELSGGAAEVRLELEADSEGLDPSTQENRANDLLGYNWVGPPERSVVSYPTMLGYTALVLVALGLRAVARQRFWLLVGGLFLVLGLGATLTVGGRSTSIPLPYMLFEHVPGLSMLRKADRFFVLVSLAWCVLVAFAWRGVALRIGSVGRQGLALAAVALLLALEHTGVPFRHFSPAVSPHLKELALHDEVTAVVHLPALPGWGYEGVYNYAQTLHEKPVARGYTTSLALTAELEDYAQRWSTAYKELENGNSETLQRNMLRTGIDWVLFGKLSPEERAPLAIDGRVLFAPFVFHKDDLVRVRQRGAFVERPFPDGELAVRMLALTRALGPPVYEDELLAVFHREAR